MTEETKVRIISALVVAPFVVACFVTYKSLVGLVSAIVILASYELFSFSLKDRSKVYISYLTALSAFFPILYGLILYEYPHMAFMIIFIVGVVSIMFKARGPEEAFQEYAAFILGITYISLGLSFFLPLYKEYGGGIALLALTGIWAFDSFAYFFGLRFGKTKIFTKYTRKSLEGVFWGFIGTLIYSGIFNYILIFFGIRYFNFKQLLIFSIVIAVMGSFGDVFESSLKRKFGVKHSGIIMPGHGGMLDRIDGLLFSTPVLYVLLKTLGG